METFGQARRAWLSGFLELQGGIPKLLRVLDLAGCIVTIDAMGCQKKIEGKADQICQLS